MTRAVWLIIAILAVALAVPAAQGVDLAPAFDLVDIDGVPMNSTALRGEPIVLEFSGTWCEPCKIVENAFKESVYPQYSSRAVFLSVFIPPLNNLSSLELHRDTRGIPWHMATDNDTVAARYNVATLPRVFVIDKNGYIITDWSPSPYAPLTKEQVVQSIGGGLAHAVAGTGTPINLTALSIPALLVIAALLSFFSPCSFPVLPAFMAYYMKLDAQGRDDPTRQTTATTAAGRGFVASLGMVAVYGTIALVVFAAGIAAQSVLPWVSPVVGVVLITFAILTLLPYQYHFLTRPFIALKKAIAAKLGGRWEPGVGAKLFAFGAGYGAAGFACVAPPFIGAVLNASALGRPQDAVLGLVLYVAIVIVTMVAVVVGLHVAGDRLLKKIRVWSNVIKYVSAAALMIAGAYLLWLFYYSSVG